MVYFSMRQGFFWNRGFLFVYRLAGHGLGPVSSPQ